jgi:hypothetical protein
MRKVAVESLLFSSIDAIFPSIHPSYTTTWYEKLLVFMVSAAAAATNAPLTLDATL